VDGSRAAFTIPGETTAGAGGAWQTVVPTGQASRSATFTSTGEVEGRFCQGPGDAPTVHGGFRVLTGSDPKRLAIPADHYVQARRPPTIAGSVALEVYDLRLTSYLVE
jgi:hypothetical protein